VGSRNRHFWMRGIKDLWAGRKSGLWAAQPTACLIQDLSIGDSVISSTRERVAGIRLELAKTS